MIEIELTQGKFAIVDDVDADLAELKWYANNTGSGHAFYAIRNVRKETVRGGRTAELMHRVILARKLGRLLGKGDVVDHIDGNGLNNRRDNLRVATHAQNMRNTRTPSTNTSGFKGVTWHTKAKKWRAFIGVDSRIKHLGLFDTPEEAHAAYCAAAEKYHGEFANPTGEVAS